MTNRPIGSRVTLNDENPKTTLYLSCVGDLLENKEVKKLDDFSQHIGTSRLQHSLNVSYYSFLISRRMGGDYRSAARAGILHDLYLYDRHVDKGDENHIFRHPKEALKNAQALTELNEIEKDAIVNHMWPLSRHNPRYFESYVVSAADKYTTLLEFSLQIGRKLKDKLYA